jgi:hypothetical protein
MSRLVGPLPISCFVSPSRSASLHRTLSYFKYDVERALQLKDASDRFCVKYRFEEKKPTAAGWAVIAIVANWLKRFRASTTILSATKSCTLSTVFSHFFFLQDGLRTALAKMEDSDDINSQQLSNGLRAAHEKLAEYLGKFSSSYFFVWAASK